MLVLIVPRDNPGRIEALADLARPGLRLVTAAPQVPIGAYTRQMLAKMSKDPAYGADFASRVLANIRSEEDNVRAVVAKVQFGRGRRRRGVHVGRHARRGTGAADDRDPRRRST